MKIVKYGKWFVSINIYKLVNVVLAFHPNEFRFMIWFRPPGRPWYRRTWIGPFEIEFSSFGCDRKWFS